MPRAFPWIAVLVAGVARPAGPRGVGEIACTAREDGEDDRPSSSIDPFAWDGGSGVVVGHGHDLVAQGFAVIVFDDGRLERQAAPWDALVRETPSFDGQYVVGSAFAPTATGAQELLVLEARQSPSWVRVQAALKAYDAACEPPLPSILTRVPLRRRAPRLEDATVELCGSATATALDIGVASTGEEIVAIGVGSGEVRTDCAGTTRVVRGAPAAGCPPATAPPVAPPTPPSAPPPGVVVRAGPPGGGASGIRIYARGATEQELRRIRVDGDAGSPSLARLHDLDGDERVDLLFSFDGTAWGVVSDVVHADLALTCQSGAPSEPALDHGSFCVTLAGRAALSADVRSYDGRSDVVFAAGAIESHTGGAASWVLETATAAAGKWSITERDLALGRQYASPRFQHPRPPSAAEDWVGLSELDFEHRETRIVFAPFAEGGLARCDRVDEGLFGDSAVRPDLGAEQQAEYGLAVAAGEWAQVELPALPASRLTGVSSGACSDGGAPLDADRLRTFPDEAAIAVKVQVPGERICVRWLPVVGTTLVLANELFHGRYHQVDFPVR